MKNNKILFIGIGTAIMYLLAHLLNIYTVGLTGIGFVCGEIFIGLLGTIMHDD